MLRLNEVKLPLDHPDSALPEAILARLGITAAALRSYTIFKRSYDARKRSAIVLIYSLDVDVADEAGVLARLAHDPHVLPTPHTGYSFVAGGEVTLPFVASGAGATAARPVVIGTGPCGLFAALILAQMGLRPIILERGKQVRERTVDTFGFWRKRELNPESNVQFGEGGAGTFSDGKLYSQIKDPKHYGRKVLTEFVKAGAPEEIMYVSKPHIGTFRLVKMVEEMRANIEAMGGEYRFESKVVDVEISAGGAGGAGQVEALVLASGERIATRHVVLAIGHSARDTFEMLHARGVYIEAKPFSIGFRVEHPQSLIDACRFGASAGHPILGAADYPGHPLAGIALQRQLEESAYTLGGGNYNAPGQLVGDFVAGRASTAFGSVTPSYKPAVHLTDLAPSLPEYAISAMREAFPAFNKQIRGYFKEDAVLTGVETRTSSPIRIKRRDDDLQSLNTRGLFPAGEGAGYAGGILSAAVDGIKVAEAVALAMAAG